MKIPHLQFLFLFLWLLPFNTIKAQSPSYIHYSTESGLPSNEVYSIIQDSKGYIWLATAMGATRFDGRTFTTYNTSNGLSNKQVLDIREDSLRRLWVLTVDGKTSYWRKGTFKEAHTILFGNKQLRAGDIIIDYKTSLLFHRDSLEQDILPDQKDYSISCSYAEDKTTIWVGTWGGGVYHCRNYKTNQQKIDRYLPQKTITSILKDRESNYWFTTLDEGVFMLSNLYTQTYKVEDGLSFEDIHSVVRDKKGHLWLGSNRGTLTHIGGSGKVLDNYNVSFSINAYNRVHDILLQKNRIWLATDEGLTFLTNNKEPFVVDLIPTKKIIATEKERFVWAARYQYPIKYDIPEGKAVLAMPLREVSSICEDLEGKIWIGNTSGLYFFDKDSLVTVQNNWLKTNISSLAIDAQNRLWVGTDGNGIRLVEIENPYQPKVLLKLEEKYGLSSDICHKIFVDATDNAWVCSNNGLNEISFESETADLSIQRYTTLEGLSSNHVQDVWVEENQVWAATSRGLSFFDKTQKPKKVNPLIHIRNVQVWYKDTILQKRYYLAHNQNNVKISYDGLSFRSQDKLQYQYKMSGVDKEWVLTDQNVIQYPTLAPGAYQLSIYAIDKDGNQSEKPAQLQFLIARHYTQQAWYRTLMALIIFGLLGMATYFIVKYFKQRSDWQRRLVESEQMALRAQMNPHFIFNSLNTIQYFITENDKKSANLYLSIFSELIRKVLENSKKTSIFLEDEIEYLSLYLNIESMRFKDKFEYNIEVASNVEIDDIRIPPMLIQPYIENAIRHGLLQKKEGNCYLYIKFEQTEEILVCVVKDNGIGRTQAAALQNRNIPKSRVGSTNPRKRLSILNKLSRRKIDVKIVDLFDNKGKGIGTKVKIIIPVF